MGVDVFSRGVPSKKRHNVHVGGGRKWWREKKGVRFDAPDELSRKSR